MTTGSFDENLGREIFSDLVGLVEDLHHCRGRVRTGMPNLIAEYRKTFDPSRLLLYTKADETGNPRGTYWGEPISAEKDAPPGCTGNPVKRIRHLKRPLTGLIIFKQTSDFRLRALYQEFDRRSLELNWAHRLLARSISAIRKILVVYTAAAPPESLSFLPSVTSLPGFPPEGVELILRGLQLIHGILEADENLRSLRDRYARDPVDDRISLHQERDGDHPYGRYRWRLEGAGAFSMTDRMLRLLRVPRPKREHLNAFEAERRKWMLLRWPHVDRITRIKQKDASITAANLHLARAASRADSPVSLPLDASGPVPGLADQGSDSIGNEASDDLL